MLNPAYQASFPSFIVHHPDTNILPGNSNTFRTTMIENPLYCEKPNIVDKNEGSTPFWMEDS
ncbi:hypothetical protein C5468_03115 [Photorhabdus luminescens subsp. mexicana]|uniref:Uncharacterized protein n=2 Tax=Photorhabdus luminescens TaxID=29488 RepID=A0A4R4JPQ6_PHOLU|nr:hypothetical protein C5468_03115 [Photorhabdus luminescens subsp. mexicana]